jgi:hypothetical protein
MKKNVFTLLAILVTAGSVSAQTEEGSWMVGGNFNLNTSSNNSAFGFSPSAGYFFANNFAAGAMFNFDYEKMSDIKNTGFGVGPFARYYFGSNDARPFLHGQWSYLSSKNETPLASSTRNGGNFLIGGGVAGFINRNVAIEGLAGYSHTKYRHASDGGTGGFALKVGFQVYLSGSQMSRVTGQ